MSLAIYKMLRYLVMTRNNVFTVDKDYDCVGFQPSLWARLASHAAVVSTRCVIRQRRCVSVRTATPPVRTRRTVFWMAKLFLVKPAALEVVPCPANSSVMVKHVFVLLVNIQRHLLSYRPIQRQSCSAETMVIL